MEYFEEKQKMIVGWKKVFCYRVNSCGVAISYNPRIFYNHIISDEKVRFQGRRREGAGRSQEAPQRTKGIPQQNRAGQGEERKEG